MRSARHRQVHGCFFDHQSIITAPRLTRSFAFFFTVGNGNDHHVSNGSFVAQSEGLQDLVCRLARKAITGSQHSAIMLTKFQRGVDHARQSDSGKTAGSAIDNCKSSKRRARGAMQSRKWRCRQAWRRQARIPPEGGGATTRCPSKMRR